MISPITSVFCSFQGLSRRGTNFAACCSFASAVCPHRRHAAAATICVIAVASLRRKSHQRRRFSRAIKVFAEWHVSCCRRIILLAGCPMIRNFRFAIFAAMLLVLPLKMSVIWPWAEQQEPPVPPGASLARAQQPSQ
jgi:hypothetical protein